MPDAAVAVLDEAGVAALGARLAAALPRGAVVYLRGDLGAGKTTLARAIARARGAGTDASSPTYALVHRYDAPGGAVFHLDCYRLRSPEEARDLDWQGLAAEADLLLIEWAERAGPWPPPADLEVGMAAADDEHLRVVRLAGPAAGAVA